MKHLFFILMICVAIAACNNESPKEDASTALGKDRLSTDLIDNPQSLVQDSAALNKLGKLVFNDTIHDFGTMTEGEMIQYEFTYKNVGSKEVIITDAVGSCGCTVPQYERKPIPPGGEAVMEVTFNSQGKLGYNEKHVNITTNANPSTYRLTILATVNK